MTPETELFLAKARKHFAEAEAMLAIAFPDAAGRAAYMASFHAAQAFIYEATGRVAKTHKGVQAEFFRLTREEARLEADLKSFLSKAYELKAMADYETGPDAVVSKDLAISTIDTSRRFLQQVSTLLGSNE